MTAAAALKHTSPLLTVSNVYTAAILNRDHSVRVPLFLSIYLSLSIYIYREREREERDITSTESIYKKFLGFFV